MYFSSNAFKHNLKTLQVDNKFKLSKLELERLQVPTYCIGTLIMTSRKRLPKIVIVALSKQEECRYCKNIGYIRTQYATKVTIWWR